VAGHDTDFYHDFFDSFFAPSIPRSPSEKSLKQMNKKSRQYSLLRRIIHADMTRTAVKNPPEAQKNEHRSIQMDPGTPCLKHPFRPD
jgi:hypothetical protein